MPELAVPAPHNRLTWQITLICWQLTNCTWDVGVHAMRENSHHIIIIIKYYNNCGSMYHWHRCRRAVGEYILHTCKIKKNEKNEWIILYLPKRTGRMGCPGHIRRSSRSPGMSSSQAYILHNSWGVYIKGLIIRPPGCFEHGNNNK